MLSIAYKTSNNSPSVYVNDETALTILAPLLVSKVVRRIGVFSSESSKAVAEDTAQQITPAFSDTGLDVNVRQFRDDADKYYVSVGWPAGLENDKAIALLVKLADTVKSIQSSK